MLGFNFFVSENSAENFVVYHGFDLLGLIFTGRSEHAGEIEIVKWKKRKQRNGRERESQIKRVS